MILKTNEKVTILGWKSNNRVAIYYFDNNEWRLNWMDVNEIEFEVINIEKFIKEEPTRNDFVDFIIKHQDQYN